MTTITSLALLLYCWMFHSSSSLVHTLPTSSSASCQKRTIGIDSTASFVTMKPQLLHCQKKRLSPFLHQSMMNNENEISDDFVKQTQTKEIEQQQQQSSNMSKTMIESDNDTGFGRYLRGLVRTGMKQTIEVGSIIIAKADIPNLSIWMDQSYEIQSIYYQGVNAGTNEVERIFVSTLEDENEEIASATVGGYTKYITLFSPAYHKEVGPVVVTPEEIGLVSLRDEVFDSVLFALPVLSFWLSTCYVFARQYNERYGGDFMDAFLGR